MPLRSRTPGRTGPPDGLAATRRPRPGQRRRRVGDRDKGCRLALARLRPDRPPDDQAEVDDRNLQHEEHEDSLPDHVLRVYAIDTARRVPRQDSVLSGRMCRRSGLTRRSHCDRYGGRFAPPRRRIDRMRLVRPLALVCALAAVLVPAAAGADRMWVGFQDDPVLRYDGTRQAEMDLASRTNNARILRTIVSWHQIAPERPANAANPFDPAYKFDDLD